MPDVPLPLNTYSRLSARHYSTAALTVTAVAQPLLAAWWLLWTYGNNLLLDSGDLYALSDQWVADGLLAAWSSFAWATSALLWGLGALRLPSGPTQLMVMVVALHAAVLAAVTRLLAG